MTKPDEILDAPEENAELIYSDRATLNERPVWEDEANSGSAAAFPPRKKRSIDESLLNEEETKKLAARRAYNRECARKARKRSKDLIAQLQNQVQELIKDKAALQRNNDIMLAQLEVLGQQNRMLMMNQCQGMQNGGKSGSMQSQFLRGGAGKSFPLLDTLSAQGRIPGATAPRQAGVSMQSGYQEGAANAPEAKKW